MLIVTAIATLTTKYLSLGAVIGALSYIVLGILIVDDSLILPDDRFDQRALNMLRRGYFETFDAPRRHQFDRREIERAEPHRAAARLQQRYHL